MFFCYFNKYYRHQHISRFHKLVTHVYKTRVNQWIIILNLSLLHATSPDRIAHSWIPWIALRFRVSSDVAVDQQPWPISCS